jgi:cbb3-type cytochrome oxidase maturation protein
VDSLYLLIPVALVLVGLGIKLLLWAIDDGQYDDLDKEAWRILADDTPAPGNNKDTDTDNGNTNEKET